MIFRHCLTRCGHGPAAPPAPHAAPGSAPLALTVYVLDHSWLESGGSSLFPWPPRCDKELGHCPCTAEHRPCTAEHQGDPGLRISAQESPPTPSLGASYLQPHQHIPAPCMTPPQDECKVEDATQLSHYLLFKFTVLPRRSLHPLRAPWR